MWRSPSSFPSKKLKRRLSLICFTHHIKSIVCSLLFISTICYHSQHQKKPAFVLLFIASLVNFFLKNIKSLLFRFLHVNIYSILFYFYITFYLIMSLYSFQIKTLHIAIILYPFKINMFFFFFIANICLLFIFSLYLFGVTWFRFSFFCT